MFIPLSKAEKLPPAPPPIPVSAAKLSPTMTQNPRSRTVSGPNPHTQSQFVTPLARTRQSTSSSATVRPASPQKSRFSPATSTPGSVTPRPQVPPLPSNATTTAKTSKPRVARPQPLFHTPSVPPRPASVASTRSSVSSRLSTSMDTTVQLSKLHRKVASLTEQLVQFRDAQPLLETALKTKDKTLAEKEHSLRLMEIERQNQRAELEEMERQVTQLQGFLEERSPHNSVVGRGTLDSGGDTSVTSLKMKLEMEELRRELEEARAIGLNGAHDSSRIKELEDLCSQYKEEVLALEADLDDARRQMREDELAQRGVVDQIGILEHVVENMERGLIAEKKLGEKNAKRIKELETALAHAQSRIEELESEKTEGVMDTGNRSRKHTSMVDSLPDGHPQKRQTVQFLEQEVEKWKRLSSALSVSGGEERRRISSASGVSLDSPEEVRGLKLIIEQMTRETAQLESENRRLKQKAEQQPQERPPQEQRGNSAPPAATGDDALRERLDNSEREKEQLKQELNDLESLLEQKIFREEELEKDLERLRNIQPLKQRAPKDHNNITVQNGSANLTTTNGRPQSITPPPRISPPPPPEDPIDESLWCEICEARGHDILGCKSVFGDKPSIMRRSESTGTNGTGTGKIGMGQRRSVGYCENCDRWDHTTEGTIALPIGSHIPRSRY
jgi:CAP-Gly domain-containing linker protein 1